MRSRTGGAGIGFGDDCRVSQIRVSAGAWNIPLLPKRVTIEWWPGSGEPRLVLLASDYFAGAVRVVTRRLLADGETAVGLYRKLAHDRAGTFLLESAENGRSWSRYSFVGVRSAATLTERDGGALWIGDTPPGVPTEGEPLKVLAATVEALREPRDTTLPPLVGGMVGFVTKMRCRLGVSPGPFAS